MRLFTYQPTRALFLSFVALALAVAPHFVHARVDSQVNHAVPSATLIRGARIFDGQRLQPAADVLIADGHIQAVASKLQAPVGAKEVDLGIEFSRCSNFWRLQW